MRQTVRVKRSKTERPKEEKEEQVEEKKIYKLMLQKNVADTREREKSV